MRLESSLASVVRGVDFFYSDYPQLPSDSFADFFVRLHPPAGIRRFARPQVNFFLDTAQPFKPLPLDQAFPLFEWGLNWCVAQNCHQYLSIHAAVLERNGRAVILPGFPGAGKSTLAAALALRGWRLLSDELTLVDLESGLIVPIPRPISIKNKAIEIVENFDDRARIGERVTDTSKGTVAHMRVLTDSVTRAQESAAPCAVLFPKYQEGAKNSLTDLDKGLVFMQLAELSFNYGVLGRSGFEAMSRLMDACACYGLDYNGDLDFAVGVLDDLVAP